MKRLPAWVARDLRPTEHERESVLQPISDSLMEQSIRYTEPDALWVRSTLRQLKELPEAKAWAPQPHEAMHGGSSTLFPNAPPSLDVQEEEGAGEDLDADSDIDVRR